METFLLLKHPIYHPDNQVNFGAIYLPTNHLETSKLPCSTSKTASGKGQASTLTLVTCY